MDEVRACHVTRMRFPGVGLVWVRWYFTDESFLTIPHAYGFWRWTRESPADEDGDDGGPGELTNDRWRFVNGRPPPDQLCIGPRGSAAAWAGEDTGERYLVTGFPCAHGRGGVAVSGGYALFIPFGGGVAVAGLGHPSLLSAGGGGVAVSGTSLASLLSAGGGGVAVSGTSLASLLSAGGGGVAVTGTSLAGLGPFLAGGGVAVSGDSSAGLGPVEGGGGVAVSGDSSASLLAAGGGGVAVSGDSSASLLAAGGGGVAVSGDSSAGLGPVEGGGGVAVSGGYQVYLGPVLAGGGVAVSGHGEGSAVPPGPGATCGAAGAIPLGSGTTHSINPFENQWWKFPVVSGTTYRVRYVRNSGDTAQTAVFYTGTCASLTSQGTLGASGCAQWTATYTGDAYVQCQGGFMSAANYTITPAAGTCP